MVPRGAFGMGWSVEKGSVEGSEEGAPVALSRLSAGVQVGAEVFKLPQASLDG